MHQRGVKLRQILHAHRIEQRWPVVYGPYYDYWRPHWSYYTTSGWVLWQPYGTSRFWADEIDSRTVEKFKAYAEIRMGKGAMPENGDRVFDARTVLADIGPTIERPDGG